MICPEFQVLTIRFSEVDELRDEHVQWEQTVQ